MLHGKQLSYNNYLDMDAAYRAAFDVGADVGNVGYDKTRGA
ncbi:MAG: hypothetical protein IAF94_07325, partial [Pirellulaceae bacterium]|nr:hypothetical protein [Pirellulaceae bacterium]